MVTPDKEVCRSQVLPCAATAAAAWAAAWASPQTGPLNLLNQTIPRQREMALRGGANIVMYVLTGNYKSDQVHVPALLERLGR